MMLNIAFSTSCSGGLAGGVGRGHFFKGAPKLVKGARNSFKFDHDHNPVSSNLVQMAVKSVKVASIHKNILLNHIEAMLE